MHPWTIEWITSEIFSIVILSLGEFKLELVLCKSLEISGVGKG